MASLPNFEINLLSAVFMLCLSFACAERDFNFNDSQISLLEPRDEPLHRYHQHPYAAEVERCHYTETEIVLSLVLKNHDWSDLSDNKKGKVLDKMSKFFAIPKEFIIMESVTKRDMYEMQKQSIRKGNNKCHNSRRLGRIDLMIGCGPKYFSMGEPIANQIGQQMRDGSIDNISDQNFGWWIIWRKNYKTRAQRNRRQIEGSGEDDYDDDSYDYDDEDGDDNVDPVTEIPTTTTHAHRHHHGGVSSKPESIETSSTEYTNNNNNNENENDIAEAIAANTLEHHKNNNNNSNQQHAAKKIDEEIVKSVSQLESVITKTIENTKNIKELPVVPGADEEGDVDEDRDADADADDDDDNDAEEEVNVAVGGGEVVLPALNNSKLPEFVAAATSSAGPDIINETGINSSIVSHRNNAVGDSSLERLNGLTAFVNGSVAGHVNENAAAAAAGEATTTTTTATTTPLHTLLTSTSTSSLQSSSSSHVSSSLPSTSTSSSQIVVVSSSPSPSPSSVSASAPASSSASAPLSPTTTTTTLPPKDEDEGEEDDDYGSDDENDNVLSLPESNRDKNVSNAEMSPTTPHYSEMAETNGQSVLTTLTSSSSGSSPTAVVAETTPSPTTTATSATTTETTTTAEAVATSSASTTTTTTEYVEPRAENVPPMIKTRLQKFAVTSGKAFRYVVPAATFYDTEDLTNLRLELTDKDGHELKPTSWLQFNAETHEIYGLPLDDAVSKWQYRLSATDSGNLSVTETLEMSVQQHRGVRSVNHEINIAVKINEKNMPHIYWQMKLIHAIATTLGDESTTNLVVREIRQTAQDPGTATFIYFNETLPSSGACPDAELNSLIQRLDVNRLLDLVSPALGIKSITGQLVGPCQKQHLAGTKPRPPTYMAKNLPPMPRNQVDRVNATVGHLLVFKVPSDTFYDPNDHELTLSLKTKDNKELSPRHWLQFDSKNQEFYGIPKSGDIGSEEYLLVAQDSGGLSATDALVVVVNHAPKKDFSVYFKAYLAIRHEQFNADLQRKFVERLAQLFGDRGTQLIQIRSITTHHDADGTIVNFYNTTLHRTHNRCPEEEIDAARSVYLLQDYRVRDRVRQALGAELNLTNVEVNISGSCSSQTNVIHHDVIPTKTEEPTLKSTFADNYMFTFIVPAVIIVTLILVASIIACCLHRRRMSGKMELGDEEERKAFRPKGIPVIFQDEFDEKPEIGNKSPIILKDEKPPLLPPSYNTSNMNGGGDNDVDEYLPPPAVVVGGREARGKSPATPSYRKPPPYVSP